MEPTEFRCERLVFDETESDCDDDEPEDRSEGDGLAEDHPAADGGEHWGCVADQVDLGEVIALRTVLGFVVITAGFGLVKHEALTAELGRFQP